MSLQLSELDRGLLAGELGPAPKVAMDLLLAVAGATGASRLVDISAAHIDGCLFHGQAGLDFARELADLGGKVRVPTTLNVSSVDLLHPELYRGDADTARLASELMEAHVALGCRPTWTCAPYQLPGRPGLGDQIAWGESNAIVFANSVLGARTNRYGDFLDLCCALTGRAPYTGLHTDEGRLARVAIDVSLPSSMLDEELTYVYLGMWMGRQVADTVPVVVGLDERADEDRLQALGAAAASTGAVAMFHAVGVTPEAPDLATALGGRAPERSLRFTEDELSTVRVGLARRVPKVGAVSVGTPHMSLSGLRRLSSLVGGLSSQIPFYVNVGRETIAFAADEGLLAPIEEFGATIVADTCTYVTPILGAIEGAVMTNSGKWAFYAPANLGVEVVMGSLEECVQSAVGLWSGFS